MLPHFDKGWAYTDRWLCMWEENMSSRIQTSYNFWVRSWLHTHLLNSQLTSHTKHTSRNILFCLLGHSFVTDSPSAPAEDFLQFKRFDQDCPGVSQGIFTYCYTVAQKDAVVNFSHQLQIDALSYSCTWHQQGINHTFFIKWNKSPDPNSSGNDNLLWLRLWALEVNSSCKNCGSPIIFSQLPGVAIFYEILYGWLIKQYCFLSPSEPGTYGQTDTHRHTHTHTHTHTQNTPTVYIHIHTDTNIHLHTHTIL